MMEANANNLMAENASTIIDSPIHLLMSHHKNQRALKHKRAQMELRERLLRQQQREKTGNYFALDEQSEIQMLQMMSNSDVASASSPAASSSATVGLQDDLLLQKRASLGSNRGHRLLPNGTGTTSGEEKETSSVASLLRRSETVTTNLNPVTKPNDSFNGRFVENKKEISFG